MSFLRGRDSVWQWFRNDTAAWVWASFVVYLLFIVVWAIASHDC